jgi:hypothetical protein
MEWEGFRRKLMFVLLLLERDMAGDAGGGMALLRDRFGEGYEMLSDTECSIGEKGKRSWEATVDKASRLCDPVSLALESLPHLLFRD